MEPGHLELRVFLEARADIDAAVYVAAQTGRLEVVGMLLASEAGCM